MTDLTTAQAEYDAAVIEHVTTLRRSRRWADRRGIVARKITERGHMLADAAAREANAASGASIRKLVGQRDEEEAAKVRAEAALAVAEAHHEEVLADLRRDLAKAQGAAADWARRCAEALQERDDVTEERDRLREQLAEADAGRNGSDRARALLIRQMEDLRAEHAKALEQAAEKPLGLICAVCGTEACASGVLMCEEAKTASLRFAEASAAQPSAVTFTTAVTDPPPLSRDLSGDLDAISPHAVGDPAPAVAPAAKKTTTRKPTAKPAGENS